MPVQQPKVLTVTLNPALDLATTTPRVTAGPKLRCETPRADAGGGGVNVARVIHRLGGATTAFVALGGATGARHARLLRDENVSVVQFGVEGETRQSLTVTENASGDQYRFVMPGPGWDDAQTRRAMERIASELQGCAVAVLSGSLPPGAPANLPAHLAAIAAQAGVPLLIDASGAALRRLVAEPWPDGAPTVLRMDAAEAAEMADHPLPLAKDSADFAAGLVERGVAGCVIVARGADGSVMATPTVRLHCRPPHVDVVSRVGAGDSFTGAFALALAQGQAEPDCLRAGTAAAAAAVLTEATALCRHEDVARLLPDCTITTLT